MATQIVKHIETGDKYRVLGEFRTWYWLQLKSDTNDTEPHNDLKTNYENWVADEPVRGDIWEHRGAEREEVRVLTTFTVLSVTLVVFKTKNTTKIQALEINDFVRLYIYQTNEPVPPGEPGEPVPTPPQDSPSP